MVGIEKVYYFNCGHLFGWKENGEEKIKANGVVISQPSFLEILRGLSVEIGRNQILILPLPLSHKRNGKIAEIPLNVVR